MVTWHAVQHVILPEKKLTKNSYCTAIISNLFNSCIGTCTTYYIASQKNITSQKILYCNMFNMLYSKSQNIVPLWFITYAI